MMNIRALDPEFTKQGKVGMKAGGALEKTVWDEYENQPEKLRGDALAIRLAVGSANELSLTTLPSVELYEGEEGGVVMRLHKRYERDRRLVKEKLFDAQSNGAVSCEVCGFDFEKKYGVLGANFIEVHHIKPLHTVKPGTKTKLADLALLCSNCHRMAHRKRIPMTLNQLRDSVNRSLVQS